MRKSNLQKHIARLRRVRKMNTPGYLHRKASRRMRQAILRRWANVHQARMQELITNSPQGFFIWLILKIKTLFSRFSKPQSPSMTTNPFADQMCADLFAQYKTEF